MNPVVSPLPYSPQSIIGQAFALDPAQLFNEQAHGQVQLDAALLHLQVYQQDSANVLLLLADLGRLPNPGRQEAQQLMLVANSGWRDLAGGALCTNESGERALLRLRLDLNTLSAEVLTQWLTAFVVAAETWAERLAAPTSPAANTATMPRDFPGMSPFNLA